MAYPIRRRARALRAGDCIGIAAPASPVREEFLEAGERVIRDLGFRVRRAPGIFNRDRYTAGSAQGRAADLESFFGDPEIRAIWCARGGYGSPQLPPLLDPELLLRDPKPIIGASDITTLLLWSLWFGVPCLHGPMPAQELARNRYDRDDLLAHLTGTTSSPISTSEMRALHPGTARGHLTGGCLSLVVASLGTPWEIQTERRLLFLEDVETKPYQIDRMLTQLDQAGKLAPAAGVMFGEMPGCRQTIEQGYDLDDVLRDLTAHLQVPVLSGLPCGHTTSVHRILSMGCEAEMSSDPVALRFLETAVV